MEQQIISNKVYESLQVPTENTRTTTGKVLYANKYSGVAEVAMPEDLRHVVLVVEQLVGHTVVAGIDHDEDIVAAHRLLHQTLGIATLEAGAVAGDDKGLLIDAGFSGPAGQVLIDQAGKFLRTGAGDEAHIRHAGLLKERLRGNFNGHNHNSLLLLYNPNDRHTKVHIYFYFITI